MSHKPMLSRKESERGRRPLLATFVGNNRQMLQEIRDSLSHLRKNQPADGRQEPVPIKPELAHLKPELSQSTPNLAEKLNGASGKNRMGYHRHALAQIRQSLQPFQNNDQADTNFNHVSGLSGLDVEVTPVNKHMLQSLINMGYDEEIASRALKGSGNKSVDAAVEIIQKLAGAHEGKLNGITKVTGPSVLVGYNTKVIRKPSFEEKYHHESPVNSDSASIRSDSPSVSSLGSAARSRSSYDDPPKLTNMQPNYVIIPSTMANSLQDRQTPPPPLPPRGQAPLVMGRGHTPTPPPPPTMDYDLNGQYFQFLPPGHVQQMVRRMSPGQRDPNFRPQGPNYSVSQPQPGGSGPVTPQRGMSPVSYARPVIMHSSPGTQHSPGMHMSLAQAGVPGRTNQMHHVNNMNGGGGVQTLMTGLQAQHMRMKYAYPPTYSQALSNKSSPTVVHSQPLYEQSHLSAAQVPEYRLMPSSSDGHTSGSSSPLTSHSPSPAPMQHTGQGTPTRAGAGTPLGVPPQPVPMQAWGARQQPIVMQSVKSREVQKPVLQTATAPLAPPMQPNYISSVQAQVNTPPSQSPPVQAQANMDHSNNPCRNVQIKITRLPQEGAGHNQARDFAHPGQIKIHIENQGPGNLQVQHGQEVLYHRQKISRDTPNSTPRSDSPVSRANNHSPLSVISTTSTPSTNSDIPEKPPPPYPGKFVSQSNVTRPRPPPLPPTAVNGQRTDMQDSPNSDKTEGEENVGKQKHTSPIPQRKPEAREKDVERRETKVRNYSPEAYKFYMEQHVENLLKSHQQRLNRRIQLETEMAKVGLSEEAQCQMRKMLHQKESNYIRLKRAKMDKSQFDKIKTLGIGAFGEVALVRKKDGGHLYAMKTLRKRDVLQRNQVAHVKAERDILAEADNEWVVKLYYSFQDKDNLYFVMDYIPGGDMMSLLIKFGIFQEPLAQFYIAELVLAIESVHNMGFIHRDIKPDNILIDRDGHIKLTDFGLCTGFRWTHNSKYYQKGNHARQDSMDPEWKDECNCDCEEPVNILKPLERRKQREKHHRCMAHSLVGTPNYIAPEVLLRSGYTSCCDWWSVGVILYEMLVGQPPFLANTPQETQMKVINWDKTLHIPKEANLSPEATDLIERLCCGTDHVSGRNGRLGHNGAQELKAHHFFRTLNLDGLRQQQAPYLPKILYPTDTSNFDPVDPERIRSSGSSDSPDLKKDGTLIENGKHPEHAFFEFTFRRFFDEGGHPVAQKMKDPETNSPVYV